jgi:hypothetical protein
MEDARYPPPEHRSFTRTSTGIVHGEVLARFAGHFATDRDGRQKNDGSCLTRSKKKVESEHSWNYEQGRLTPGWRIAENNWESFDTLRRLRR